MPVEVKQSHTPESVKHRHAQTRTMGIFTSSNGKPGGLRWEVKYTDPSTGTQKWSPAFARRQDALSFQAEVRGKADVGTVIGNPSTAFRQLVEQWKIVRDTKVRKTTAQAQDMHLRVHILPVLGSRKVRDISRATVLTWQAGLKRHDGRGALGPNTVNLIRTTLSDVLDHAVAAHIIAINPCKTLTRGDKPKGTQPEKTILADGDLDKLLASVGRRKWMADVIEVALGQALRLGEVAGLDWSDVDFAASTLTVERSVSKKTGEVGPTKNGKAQAIRLTPSTRKVLARMHLAAGRPASGPVFASDGGSVEGGYRHPSTIERAFKDTYDRSGIETPRLGMHSLRHTAISHLANDPRIPLDATRRFARHSDITITQKYIHEVKSADVDEAMDDTMAGIG